MIPALGTHRSTITTTDSRVSGGVQSRRADAATAVRSAVEHVFARQKGPMGLVVRTIGIARARVKIGLANLAYNLKRFVWLSSRPATA